MKHDSTFNPVAVAAAVALVAAAAAIVWYFWPDRPDAEPVVVEQPDTAFEEPEADEGPRFPLPPQMPERQRPADLEPLPPLDDSDQYFEMQVGDVVGEQITDLLVDEALIEKLVTTADNLPRQSVAERIRPVGRLPGEFLVDGQDASGEFSIDPSNYDRYDPVVNMLVNADREALVDLYTRFYPLFQEAYANLGYPNSYFNDRVVEVIDHLLATPDVSDPVTLVRPHVLYEYADPELEALSAGQKLLIRIGPAHRAVVRDFLEDLRDRITAGLTPAP